MSPLFKVARTYLSQCCNGDELKLYRSINQSRRMRVTSCDMLNTQDDYCGESLIYSDSVLAFTIFDLQRVNEENVTAHSEFLTLG